jgi:branched-chain amino acid transport system permease protein
MEKKTLQKSLICGLILLIVVLFPLFSNNFIIRFGTDILMFAVLASAWNIIGGYTGYASFGNVVFF